MCGVVTISAETFHTSVHRICLQPTPHKLHCSMEKICPLHCVWFDFLCGRMLVQCRYRVNELVFFFLLGVIHIALRQLVCFRIHFFFLVHPWQFPCERQRHKNSNIFFFVCSLCNHKLIKRWRSDVNVQEWIPTRIERYNNSFNFRPDCGRPLKFIDRIVLRFLSLFLWPNICRRAHSYTFSPYIANRVNDKNVYRKRKRALIDVCHVPCRTWSMVVYTCVQVVYRVYTLHSHARSRGYESSYSHQCCEGIRSL